MRKKLFSINYFILIPLVFSSILCILLIFFLDQKITNAPAFIELLEQQISLFIAISGVASILLVGYIVFSIFGANRLLGSSNNNLNVLVNKMNAARKIIERVLQREI